MLSVMETRRWTNPTQPQTLQVAVFLFYIRAVFTLLGGLELQYIVFPFSDIGSNGTVSNPLLRIGLPIAMAAAAFLIANERRSGYQLGVVTAALPLIGRLLLTLGISLSSIKVSSTSPLSYDLLGLVFEVALFALLVHPQSREYERIWFK
jgi:hypothetical protein